MLSSLAATSQNNSSETQPPLSSSKARGTTSDEKALVQVEKKWSKGLKVWREKNTTPLVVWCVCFFVIWTPGNRPEVTLEFVSSKERSALQRKANYQLCLITAVSPWLGMIDYGPSSEPKDAWWGWLLEYLQPIRPTKICQSKSCKLQLKFLSSIWPLGAKTTGTCHSSFLTLAIIDKIMYTNIVQMCFSFKLELSLHHLIFLDTRNRRQNNRADSTVLSTLRHALHAGTRFVKRRLTSQAFHAVDDFQCINGLCVNNLPGIFCTMRLLQPVWFIPRFMKENCSTWYPKTSSSDVVNGRFKEFGPV